MEAYKETSDDSTHYHGGISSMDLIREKTDDLIGCILESEVLKRYQQAYSQVKQNQDLMVSLNNYRGLLFRLSVEETTLDLYEETARIEQEYKELLKSPEAQAYLEAEVELCRLLQSIEQNIHGAIELHLPE